MLLTSRSPVVTLIAALLATACSSGANRAAPAPSPTVRTAVSTPPPKPRPKPTSASAAAFVKAYYAALNKAAVTADARPLSRFASELQAVPGFRHSDERAAQSPSPL